MLPLTPLHPPPSRSALLVVLQWFGGAIGAIFLVLASQYFYTVCQRDDDAHINAQDALFANVQTPRTLSRLVPPSPQGSSP